MVFALEIQFREIFRGGFVGRINESKKLSIEYYRKVLNGEGKEYTDEQIKKLRDILYILGELDYTIYMEIIKKDEEGNTVR